MEFEKQIKNHFLKGHEIFLRHISIDCVVFGFHENELRALLLKSRVFDKLSLPGGFVMLDEAMDAAAHRILKERTGLDKIFLQQFHVFSDPLRSHRKLLLDLFKEMKVAPGESWMFERFISAGYSALVDFTKVKPMPDILSETCQWFSIKDIPELALDHNLILEKALEHLRLQLNYQPVGYNLLPLKFTMPELQALYETVLDRKLDRRNFHRKMMSTGILIKLKETKKGVAHKAPFYYKFDLHKYEKALKVGMGFQL
ncbi:MAG TPA: NUDIX domain-containing protein [Hanamia sp.]